MPPRNRLVFTFALAALSCGQIPTQQLLDGDFSGNDTSPPIPLSPAKNGRVIGLLAQLTWSARSGAAKYYVEISTTSDFSKPISGSPFTAAEAALQVTLPATAGYWWRVKAPFTKGTLNSSLFDAITDGVYVYCPENTTCDDANRGGSKGNPYQSIGVALGAAKTLGLPVRVASRGASGQAYPEAISLVDGVNMYGGYDSNFVESQRNTATNVTAISSGAITVTASYVTKSTVFDGFKVAGQGGFGMYLDQSNINLVVSNSTISSGDVTTGNTYGIFCISSSATITRNTITGGRILTVGASGASYAIYNLSSSPNITNNVLVGGPTPASGTGDSYGMHNGQGSSPKIINNTIFGGSTQNSTPVAISIGESGATLSSSPWIINNVLSTISGPGSRFCVREWGGSGLNANPAFLQNNLFVNCAQMYVDVNGGGTSLTIGAVNTAASTVAPGLSSGNVDISGGQNPFVNLAAGNYRLQNNGAPMTAQEWLNVAYGGQNTTGAAYGTVTTDRDGVSRTAVAGGAINTGAAGYSIGAYEF